VKRIRLFALAFVVAVLASAHDVITTNLTFTRDISRIFAAHCLACHAEGSSIPLVTYEEARPWAVAIKEQVLKRSMPPWGAVKGFGDLSPDSGLSQEDIMIIAAWVIGGAPRGNMQLLPPMRAAAQAPTPAMRDELIVETRVQLRAPLETWGIRPVTDAPIESARLIARLPDGRIEPLVWLYQFDPKMSHTFTFRSPLHLPQGTVLESSMPVRFALTGP
jgi:hypothetical protein